MFVNLCLFECLFLQLNLNDLCLTLGQLKRKANKLDNASFRVAMLRHQIIFLYGIVQNFFFFFMIFFTYFISLFLVVINLSMRKAQPANITVNIQGYING